MTFTPSDLAEQLRVICQADQTVHPNRPQPAWVVTHHARQRSRSRQIDPTELALTLDDWEVCYPARGGRRILCHGEVFAVVNPADRSVITAFRQSSRSAGSNTQAA